MQITEAVEPLRPCCSEFSRIEPKVPARRLGMKQLKIGSGAGYSGDRIEPALELAEKGEIKYLVFECLAERTIALAQQSR
jgi:hypothetical protein